MTRRLQCAICGRRDASQRTDWDGREIWSCSRCLNPPAQVTWSRAAIDAQLLDAPSNDAERIMAIVARNPGATTADVLEILGVEQGGHATDGDVQIRRRRDCVDAMLSRLVRKGALRRVDTPHHHATYYAVRDKEVA